MHDESSLQISRFENDSFWQEKRGFGSTIYHFILLFLLFMEFLLLEAIAAQSLASRRRLPKKSYLKTYRRFLFIGSYGKIFSVRIEEDMNDIEDEAVTRPRPSLRPQAKISPTICEAERPTLFSGGLNGKANFRMPAAILAEESYWRRLACVGGSASNSRQLLIFTPGLRKSLIFLIFSDISHVILQMGKTRLAGACSENKS
jgi:hypothetical protein